MSYGFRAWSPDGKFSADPLRLGCVCFGRYSVPRGTSTTLTFPEIAAGDLRFMYLGRNSHGVTIVDAGGVAGLQFTDRGIASAAGAATVVVVFARNTIGESNYGFLAVTETGERLVSILKPTPQFVGKATFAPNTSSGVPIVGQSGLRRKVYSAGTNLGPGRNRIILYSLPSVSGNYWYSGTSYVSSAVTGGYTISMDVIYPQGLEPPIPEAYVFGIDSLVSSGDIYGFRTWDSFGNLTFDAGSRHMSALGSYTGIRFPVSNGPQLYEYVMPEMGLTSKPAVMTPLDAFESSTPLPNGQIGSTIREWIGYVQREGTTYRTVRFQTDASFEDARSTYSNYYGGVNNSTFIVDAAIYD